jgi:hypothetical protein
MASNGLRLSTSCYSQDALRSSLVLSRVYRQRARRQVEGIEPLVHPLAGVAAVISILWLEAISSGSPSFEAAPCRSSRALLRIIEGRVGMARIAWMRSKAQRDQFSLSPLLRNRWARHERVTVSARFDFIGHCLLNRWPGFEGRSDRHVGGGAAHHVPHDRRYGFALRD